jgi:hypothetical protein
MFQREMQKSLECSLERFMDIPPLRVLRMIAAACYPTNWMGYELDRLYSALVTLPALESITLSRRLRPEHEFASAYSESLTELLRLPTLRSVYFYQFSFKQATANAFIEGTAVTKIEFSECRFSARECDAIMAKALASNTSVACLDVLSQCDGTLCNALVVALPSNSTLRDSSFLCDTVGPDHLSPGLLALGKK